MRRRDRRRDGARPSRGPRHRGLRRQVSERRAAAPPTVIGASPSAGPAFAPVAPAPSTARRRLERARRGAAAARPAAAPPPAAPPRGSRRGEKPFLLVSPQIAYRRARETVEPSRAPAEWREARTLPRSLASSRAARPRSERERPTPSASSARARSSSKNVASARRARSSRRPTRRIASLGTLINLAFCHKEQGASWYAWLEFREAEVKATELNRADRRDFAHARLVELEKQLPKRHHRQPAEGPADRPPRRGPQGLGGRAGRGLRGRGRRAQVHLQGA